jgi:hypothetical protein
VSASWSGEQPEFPQGQPSETDLVKAKAIMEGEGPLIAEPPDTSVTLFRGIWDGNRFRADATVKELTGADEEGIARMMGASAPVQYMNAVLAYGVSQLGPHELEKMTVQERMGYIDTLLVGEKEYLFLLVLRATYGDERTVPVQCQSCFAMNEVFFSITDDVPIKKMEDPTRTLYEYETKSGHRIEYRLVCGADAAESQKRPNMSGPEENTIILSRIIEQVDGRTLVDPTKFVRNLGAMDRRNLMREVVSKQPGPYFEEVKLPCATCGAESLFTPSWGDLL